MVGLVPAAPRPDVNANRRHEEPTLGLTPSLPPTLTRDRNAGLRHRLSEKAQKPSSGVETIELQQLIRERLDATKRA